MTYIATALIPIAEESVDDYEKLAREVREVWLDHGALDYKEALAEDLEPEMGRALPGLLGIDQAETLILSMITFEDREHLDTVKAAVMEDERLGQLMGSEGPPYDASRMTSGGFEVIVGGD